MSIIATDDDADGGGQIKFMLDDDFQGRLVSHQRAYIFLDKNQSDNRLTNLPGLAYRKMAK